MENRGAGGLVGRLRLEGMADRGRAGFWAGAGAGGGADGSAVADGTGAGVGSGVAPAVGVGDGAGAGAAPAGGGGAEDVGGAGVLAGAGAGPGPGCWDGATGTEEVGADAVGAEAEFAVESPAPACCLAFCKACSLDRQTSAMLAAFFEG